MATLYWCPHQVLKATGAPVFKENMVVDFIPNSNLTYLSYPFSPPHDQCVNQLVLLSEPERAQERLGPA